MVPSRADFLFGPTIGQGKFSNVLYARHKKSSVEVAIKIVDQFTLKRCPDLVQMICKEQDFLRRLKSPHVVSLLAFFSDSDFVYMVQDLAFGGDMNFLMRFGLSSTNTTKWHQSIPHYCRQIVDATCYIHSKDIIHGDIKPQNILHDGRGKLKLADFGSSFKCNSKVGTHFAIGTTEYSSPEVLTSSRELSVAIDFWSVGCVIYALFVGESPFHAASEALVVESVMDYAKGKSTVSMYSAEMLPISWNVIVNGLLNVNPVDRSKKWEAVRKVSRDWNEPKQLLSLEAPWKQQLAFEKLQDGSECSITFHL